MGNEVQKGIVNGIGEAFYGTDTWTRMTTPRKPTLKKIVTEGSTVIVMSCIVAVITVATFAAIAFMLNWMLSL